MLTIQKISHHRNGICGEGFHVVLFTDTTDNDLYATVFPDQGCVAVLQVSKLAQGIVEFGYNSWRGDDYEEELREAIRSYEKAPNTGDAAVQEWVYEDQGILSNKRKITAIYSS